MNMKIHNTYAKKRGDMWLPIHIHAFDVSEVAQRVYYAMCDESNRSDSFVNLVKLVGYLHDVGKLTDSFQRRIKKGAKNGTRHDSAGEAILIKYGFNRRIASIVGAHHGIPQKFGFEPEDYYITALGEDPEELSNSQKLFIHNALEYSGFDTLENVPEIDVAEMHLLWGIVSVADWIASDEVYFPLFPLDQNDLSPEEHHKRVRDAFIKLDMPNRWKPSLPRMSQNEFIKRFGFRPNNSQRLCYKIANDMTTPGILVIEEKMGGGKTEGALACAEVLATKFNCSGVAFLLPTKATTDCMFDRVTDWIGKQSDTQKHSVSLSHSSAFLNESYLALEEPFKEGSCIMPHEFFKRAKTDLLANFTIATVDKAIISTLKTKHYDMKLLGLHNKVVIIDECHAYDDYMNTYLDGLLEFLGYLGTPVIILSATLPAGRRREIIEAYNKCVGLENNFNRYYAESKKHPISPRITWTNNGCLDCKSLSQGARKKDVVIDVKRINSDDIEKVLRSELKDGGCAGIMVNTVSEAQELGSYLRDVLKGFHVTCIHSMFTDEDRKRMEDRIYARVGKESGRKKRDKAVVVGTQVLEQSLDIDFDVLMTQMCPADLLFQRIGRLHRHDRYRPKSLKSPRLYIITDNKSYYSVYDPWILSRTNRRIGKSLSIPSQIPRIVNGVYSLTQKEKRAFEEYMDTGNSTFKLMDNKKCGQYMEYKAVKEDKHRRASAFRIKLPSEYTDVDTLDGALDNAPRGDSKDKVRDGLDSISVYVVANKGKNLLRWAPNNYEHKTYGTTGRPRKEYIDTVLRQRISLPRYFSTHKDETLNELSTMLAPEAKKIFYSNSILRRGNFLAFEKGNVVTLCGKHLHYDKELGLCMS